MFDLGTNSTIPRFQNFVSLHSFPSALHSEQYSKGILESHYGFPYNPPGFEALYTYQLNYNILKKGENKISRLMDIQQKNNFDRKSNSFSKNVHDKNTSSARIYELAESL